MTSPASNTIAAASPTDTASSSILESRSSACIRAASELSSAKVESWRFVSSAMPRNIQPRSSGSGASSDPDVDRRVAVLPKRCSRKRRSSGSVCESIASIRVCSSAASSDQLLARAGDALADPANRRAPIASIKDGVVFMARVSRAPVNRPERQVYLGVCDT